MHSVLWLTLHADAAEPTPALEDDSLRAVCERAIGAWELGPGVVIAWVGPHGSGVVGCGASGNSGSPEVTEHTVFELGSLTKLFTASLLGDMVDRGEVRLDEPLSAFAPGGPAAFASSAIGGATLEQLATHTSGLPRLVTSPRGLGQVMFFRGNPYRGLGPDSVWTDVLGVDEAPPKPAYLYSNLGAAVLGQALAARAGKPYSDLVAERVLIPLGMNATTFTRVEADAGGHSVNGLTTPAWTLDGFAPAGGLRAPAADVLRFLSANLDQTAPGSLTAQRGRLGWHASERRGHAVLEHSGGTGGFASFLAMSPERRLGVFVVANATSRVDGLGRWLLDTGGPPAPPGVGWPGGLAVALLGLHASLTLLLPRWGLAIWPVVHSRGDAAAALWSTAAIMAIVATMVELRGFPLAMVLGVGVVSLAAHAWALWRVHRAPDPLRPWPARVWQVAFLAGLGWFAFVSPWRA